MNLNSFLIVDKELDPILITHPGLTSGLVRKRNTADVIPYLESLGKNAELVWSIEKHVFDDFHKYRNDALQLVKEYQDGLSKPDDRNRFTQDLAPYLRTTPISSVEDLGQYDCIIAHPWVVEPMDFYMLYEFNYRFPNKPLFLYVGIDFSDEFLPGVSREDDTNVFEISTKHTNPHLALVQLIKRLEEKS